MPSLGRNKHLLITWPQSLSTVILEPKKIKSVNVSICICHEVMGPYAMIFIFWMLSFKPAFSLSSFTFIKRPFSSSLLSAVRVVSSFPLLFTKKCTYTHMHTARFQLPAKSSWERGKSLGNIRPSKIPFPIALLPFPRNFSLNLGAQNYIHHNFLLRKHSLPWYQFEN